MQFCLGRKTAKQNKTRDHWKLSSLFLAEKRRCSSASSLVLTRWWWTHAVECTHAEWQCSVTTYGAKVCVLLHRENINQSELFTWEISPELVGGGRVTIETSRTAFARTQGSYVVRCACRCAE